RHWQELGIYKRGGPATGRPFRLVIAATRVRQNEDILMSNPLWIPVTIAAATFQVGRNALQRGVMSASGPWGATLVRFLFGLPFSLVFVAIGA
ncbi:hypothetical protein ACTGU8_11890, partial [Streptococcus suis]